MDTFDSGLRARLDALEQAAPVTQAHTELTVRRRRATVPWLAAVGVAAGLVLAVGVAWFAPQTTDAATRTYPLNDAITVTARTHAAWSGTIDLATAEKAITETFGSKLTGAQLHVTASWQVASTLEVKGNGWSMSWSGPTVKPVDVWVVEYAGTSPEGWPMTVDGVVDARSGTVLGGGIGQQVPQSLQGDPNKPVPST